MKTTYIHCLYSFLGYLFVDAETPRQANEQLLNNLGEGVFILEKDCSSVAFLNSAAKNFMCNPDFDVSKAEDDESGTAIDSNQLFDWDKEMFAEMDSEIFLPGQNVDTASTALKINQLDSY